MKVYPFHRRSPSHARPRSVPQHSDLVPGRRPAWCSVPDAVTTLCVYSNIYTSISNLTRLLSPNTPSPLSQFVRFFLFFLPFCSSLPPLSFSVPLSFPCILVSIPSRILPFPSFPRSSVLNSSHPTPLFLPLPHSDLIPFSLPLSPFPSQPPFCNRTLSPNHPLPLLYPCLLSLISSFSLSPPPFPLPLNPFPIRRACVRAFTSHCQRQLLVNM